MTQCCRILNRWWKFNQIGHKTAFLVCCEDIWISSIFPMAHVNYFQFLLMSFLSMSFLCRSSNSYSPTWSSSSGQTVKTTGGKISDIVYILYSLGNAHLPIPSSPFPPSWQCSYAIYPTHAMGGKISFTQMHWKTFLLNHTWKVVSFFAPPSIESLCSIWQITKSSQES